MDTEFMQNIEVSNNAFAVALSLINTTSKDVFLTGKAGTGKTTFLRYLKQHCPKQLAVVAPTGVAAINAGGVTIHSFFQLPFSPFVPVAVISTGNEESTNKHSLFGHLRLNTERMKLIRALELLIIDEVSMVRCDVLDAMDLVLRHVRNRQERFGGVQVLFIGDLFQLPPVTREGEWNLLREYYNSPYFFDSHVIRDQAPFYIEFSRIYRQSEEKFIRLLNKVRNNELDDEHLNMLQQRYRPDFLLDASDGYIVLTTHNSKAQDINSRELSRLEGEMFLYKAVVEGDFPPGGFPAEETLQLKTGAQVMFIKNDTDKERRYYNGKIGIVEKLTDKEVTIRCKGEEKPIHVKREKWENIRYTIDKSTRRVNEDRLGSFSQYPLRLAWAITIHKSQGLTFDRVVIDAGNAFAPGQVYVALSRCSRLEGLILHSPIREKSVYSDDRIVRFIKSALPDGQMMIELEKAKKEYQKKIFYSVFNFGEPVLQLDQLIKYVSKNESSFNEPAIKKLNELKHSLVHVQNVATKFHQRLNRIFGFEKTEIENDGDLKESIDAAARWFVPEICSIIKNIEQLPVSTDSTLHAKEFNESFREIFVQLCRQKFLLEHPSHLFMAETYHQRKNCFVAPVFALNVYGGASGVDKELKHPELFYRLKKLRDTLCDKANLPVYMIAGSKTLEEMATYLPDSNEELICIKGFGKIRVGKYGEDFLSVIRQYCQEKNLRSAMHEIKPKDQRQEKKQSRKDTRMESFQLFKEGKSVSEIAMTRGLTTGTIERHLSRFVEEGKISITELVEPDKIRMIQKELEENRDSTAFSVKQKLGDKITYGDIHLVWASIRYHESSAHIHH